MSSKSCGRCLGNFHFLSFLFHLCPCVDSKPLSISPHSASVPARSLFLINPGLMWPDIVQLSEKIKIQVSSVSPFLLLSSGCGGHLSNQRLALMSSRLNGILGTLRTSDLKELLQKPAQLKLKLCKDKDVQVMKLSGDQTLALKWTPLSIRDRSPESIIFLNQRPLCLDRCCLCLVSTKMNPTFSVVSTLTLSMSVNFTFWNSPCHSIWGIKMWQIGWYLSGTNKFACVLFIQTRMLIISISLARWRGKTEEKKQI